MEFLQIILHFDHYLDTLIGHYGALIYLVLFAIVFCETAFAPLFFLPGNPLIFISGAFCATGQLKFAVVTLTLASAAVLGSMLNYRIGRYIGPKIFSQKYKYLDQDSLRKTQAFYAQYGGVTFVLSLFIPVVRTFAPLVAGVALMRFARFVGFVTLGAIFWVLSLVIGGYFFGNIPLIHDHLNSIMLLGIGGALAALAANGVWRSYRKKRIT